MSDKSDFLFTDYISMPETNKYFSDAQNLLQDFQSSNVDSALRVTIRATHSGYLLNGRVYPGMAVRDGASSWLSKSVGAISWPRQDVFPTCGSHTLIRLPPEVHTLALSMSTA